jgi:hypothetical protein
MSWRRIWKQRYGSSDSKFGWQINVRDLLHATAARQRAADIHWIINWIDARARLAYVKKGERKKLYFRRNSNPVSSVLHSSRYTDLRYPLLETSEVLQEEWCMGTLLETSIKEQNFWTGLLKPNLLSKRYQVHCEGSGRLSDNFPCSLIL